MLRMIFAAFLGLVQICSSYSGSSWLVSGSSACLDSFSELIMSSSDSSLSSTKSNMRIFLTLCGRVSRMSLSQSSDSPPL